jgi:hypothetical protein
MSSKKTSAKTADTVETKAVEAAAQPAKATPAPEMLKKMSAKNVMGGRVRLAEGENERELYTIFGLANGLKNGTSDFGDWIALMGQFKAVRGGDGAVFYSAKAFLPDVAQDMIVAAVKSAQEDDKNASVEFAYVIGIREADTATGYEYTCRPLIEQRADALASLETRLAGRLALPNPNA